MLFRSLQVILLLKSIELVRGQTVQEDGSGAQAIQYVNAVPYNQNGVKTDSSANSAVPNVDVKPTYYDHHTGSVIAAPGPADAGNGQSRSLPVYQQRKQTMYQRRHRRPYWSSTSTSTEAATTMIVEEVIEYSDNGTEINRENVTKVVRLPPQQKLVPLCPVRFFFWEFCPLNIPILNLFLPKEYYEY